MGKWNQNSDLKCAFCKQCKDSHENLFFQCKFHKTIWKVIRKWMYKVENYETLANVIEQLAINHQKIP